MYKDLGVFKVLSREKEREKEEAELAWEKIDLRVFITVHKPNLLTYCPSTVVEDGWHWRELSQSFESKLILVCDRAGPIHTTFSPSVSPVLLQARC